ncbi:hypothetical protein [Mameliella sp.]|uniref:hypothetical protein n=1 Tax=Mameliella sp. TaxID=1924940 RepID=UPI003BAC33DE
MPNGDCESILTTAFTDLIRDSTEMVEKFRGMILATPPEGLAGCFTVVRDADLCRTNSLIKRPTLVIGGTDDTVTQANHSEEIARSIPGSSLCLFQGDHMLNVEKQEDFLKSVKHWLLHPPS